ncbi:MAG: undecaprenyl-diphosphate phosphatase [Rickettsiales bacterium]|jgi:undecaprenyl-diphosphatase|nr:undecaprenyl-diphosphate phosphatase [Rickettsiales bacterium]
MILFFLASFATIQALTEFLPISSSAHIILLSKLFGLKNIAFNENNDLMMAISLHLGSLLAVVIFYCKDIFQMLTFKNITLIWKMFFAFLPVAIIGGIIAIKNISLPESTTIIGIMLIIFGIILYAADKFGQSTKEIKSINVGQAFIIGCAQLIALIPGVSRSGITITTARIIGMKRDAAVKFSLLLSIPTIGASAFLLVYKIITQPFYTKQFSILYIYATAFALSAIVSYFVLRLFVKVANRFTFFPFVIYRIILGALLLIFV